MKDYSSFGRDIYRPPQRRAGRGWWTLIIVLLVAAVAVAVYFQFRDPSPSPEPQATEAAPDPNIIPLTLPPRSPNQAPATRQ